MTPCGLFTDPFCDSVNLVISSVNIFFFPLEMSEVASCIVVSAQHYIMGLVSILK